MDLFTYLNFSIEPVKVELISSLHGAYRKGLTPMGEHTCPCRYSHVKPPQTAAPWPLLETRGAHTSSSNGPCENRSEVENQADVALNPELRFRKGMLRSSLG